MHIQWAPKACCVRTGREVQIDTSLYELDWHLIDSKSWWPAITFEVTSGPTRGQYRLQEDNPPSTFAAACHVPTDIGGIWTSECALSVQIRSPPENTGQRSYREYVGRDEFGEEKYRTRHVSIGDRTLFQGDQVSDAHAR